MTSGHTDPPPTEKQVGVSGPFPSAPWLWGAPVPQGLLPPARLHPPGGPICRASSAQSLQGRWALRAPPETGPHPVGPLSPLPGVQESSIGVDTGDTDRPGVYKRHTWCGCWGAGGGPQESLCSLCREPDIALESERQSDVCDTAAGGPAEAGVPLSPPHVAGSFHRLVGHRVSHASGHSPCSRAPGGHPGLPQNQGHPRQAGVWGSGGEG